MLICLLILFTYCFTFDSLIVCYFFLGFVCLLFSWQVVYLVSFANFFGLFVVFLVCYFACQFMFLL
jgi:hypothetical protein